MAMNMNLILQQEIRVLRAGNERRMKKNAKKHFFRGLPFYLLTGKVVNLFSSLINIQLNLLHLASELPTLQ